MAFKPNYNQQRADRNRAKAQKKQEKLKRLEEETAKRKAARGEQPDPEETREDRYAGVNPGPKNSPLRAASSCLTCFTRTVRRPRTGGCRPPSSPDWMAICRPKSSSRCRTARSAKCLEFPAAASNPSAARARRRRH